jgi:hypothetical protein
VVRARLRNMSGRQTKGGLVQVTLTLDPDHLSELRAEALRRAREKKSGRPDTSAVVREILEAWVKRSGKR